MIDFMLLMHDDADPEARAAHDWAPYFEMLRASGHFQGGSSIGDGVCVNKAGRPVAVGRHLVGYIRIRARDLEEARALLHGNPIFEAGGTVEVRELPRD